MVLAKAEYVYLDLLETSYGQVAGSLARFEVRRMYGRSPRVRVNSRITTSLIQLGQSTCHPLGFPPTNPSGNHRPSFHTETTAVLPDSGPSVSN